MHPGENVTHPSALTSRLGWWIGFLFVSILPLASRGLRHCGIFTLSPSEFDGLGVVHEMDMFHWAMGI